MAANTAIEWADDTVNFWWGCEKISTGCKFCYAEAWDARWGGEHWGPSAPRKHRHDNAVKDLRKAARRSRREFDKTGRKRRVFVQSMSDTFEDRPDLVEPRRRMWDAMQEASGDVQLLVLTKRPDVMLAHAQEYGKLPGAVMMCSVVVQEEADRLLPILVQVPADYRGVSMEPLLGPVDLNLFGVMPGDLTGGAYRPLHTLLDWAIVGGESGPKARPMHPDWARSIRDQCVEAQVPFLLKQWGAWAPRSSAPWGGTVEERVSMLRDGRLVASSGNPEAMITLNEQASREFCATVSEPQLQLLAAHLSAQPQGNPLGYQWMGRCGKHAAGRLLDGRTWDEFPGGADA